jgi:colanic acid biosynthesis glycosyl transferase WcaI
MCAWLAQAGHEVRVVAAPPYYPQWRVAPEYAGKGYMRECVDGVDVWRAPLWVPGRLSGFSRIVHLLSFALTSAPLVLRQALWRPDVVVTVAPAIFCAPAGWLTARLCGASAWLHVQDFEIDVGFRLGLVKGGLLRRSIFAAERWLLNRFDRVSTISRRMLDGAASKGVPESRLILFPNWVDTNVVRPHGAASRFRAELAIPEDAVVALYSGTLGAKHGLHLIPEAARRLAQRSDIIFVICGDGVMKPGLVQACESLPNVRFLPLQPIERLGELLGTADVHLLTQSPDVQDQVMPSKLSGMLASGRPVVATCNPGTEIDAVVRDCGRIVPPDNAAALATAIMELATAPELRQRLGRQARHIAQTQFARDAVLRRFRAELHRAANLAQDGMPIEALGSRAEVIPLHSFSIADGQPRVASTVLETAAEAAPSRQHEMSR